MISVGHARHGRIWTAAYGGKILRDLTFRWNVTSSWPPFADNMYCVQEIKNVAYSVPTFPFSEAGDGNQRRVVGSSILSFFFIRSATRGGQFETYAELCGGGSSRIKLSTFFLVF